MKGIFERLKGVFKRQGPYRRGYQGAKINRFTADWLTPSLVADHILRWSLPILRNRSRDLERNNDYVRNFLRKLEINVIGPKGVILQAKAKKALTEELDLKNNQIIEQEWERWSKHYATVDGIPLRDACKMVLRSVARDGEVIVRCLRGFDNPYGFALQIIEADHLDERLNQDLPNGNKITLGVEKDIYGRAVAYWLWEKHPGETLQGNRHIRVPADEIIHLFIKERPSQSRGVPWVATAMLKLRMLGAYEEAEVIAARVSAGKMGFFIQVPEAAQYTGKTEGEELISEVEPGILEILPPGVDFKPFDPGRPSADFDKFVKAMLRGISAGLGCNYNTLCNDLESVNYSSLRAGALEEREVWMDLQEWFIDNFLEKVYEAWFEMAYLAGRINVPYGDIERYKVHIWQARRWDWVDPLKDIQAKILELKNALTTRTRILAEKGIDFEDILEELVKEKELMSKYGLKIEDVDEKMSLVLMQKIVEEGEENGNKA